MAEHQGSVVATVNSANGGVNHVRYLPFGNIRDAGTVDDKGFLNQTHDPTTGLIYLNARHHDPTLGNFVSVDPLVVQTGEPYIYGGTNPILYSDPSGLCSQFSMGSDGGWECDFHNTGSPTRVCNEIARCNEPTKSDPPPVPLSPQQAGETVVDAGSITLIPNAPSRPENPTEAAIWDYMYGGVQHADADFLDWLAGTLEASAPYVAGGALAICIVGSGGLCGVVTAAAAVHSLSNNGASCLASCEDLGDVVETTAKIGVDVTLARLPAPNGFVSSASVRRLVDATGGTDAWATEVFRNRRIVVSAIGTAGSSQWEIP